MDANAFSNLPVFDLILGLDRSSNPGDQALLRTLQTRLKPQKISSPLAPYDGLEVHAVIAEDEAIPDILDALEHSKFRLDLFDLQTTLPSLLELEDDTIWGCQRDKTLVLVATGSLTRKWDAYLVETYGNQEKR